MYFDKFENFLKIFATVNIYVFAGYCKTFELESPLTSVRVFQTPKYLDDVRYSYCAVLSSDHRRLLRTRPETTGTSASFYLFSTCLQLRTSLACPVCLSPFVSYANSILKIFHAFVRRIKNVFDVPKYGRA